LLLIRRNQERTQGTAVSACAFERVGPEVNFAAPGAVSQIVPLIKSLAKTMVYNDFWRPVGELPDTEKSET
jgi:hypothetical protein